MSKTLLFTTSFCINQEEWNDRILKWYNYFKSSRLFYQKLLILDDGSPSTPSWKDCQIITEQLESEPDNKDLIIKFKKNLGRPAHLDYPGWFRSFSFAARYAYKFQYDKIIHIESDAYLLSNFIFNFFNKIQDGWTSLWCHRHQFPETAIQIIGRDQIINFFKITQLPYSQYYRGKTIETCLPFTSINKSFTGDRYHEYRDDIPPEADYACQVKHNYQLL